METISRVILIVAALLLVVGFIWAIFSVLRQTEKEPSIVEETPATEERTIIAEPVQTDPEPRPEPVSPPISKPVVRQIIKTYVIEEVITHETTHSGGAWASAGVDSSGSAWAEAHAE